MRLIYPLEDRHAILTQFSVALAAGHFGRLASIMMLPLLLLATRGAVDPAPQDDAEPRRGSKGVGGAAKAAMLGKGAAQPSCYVDAAEGCCATPGPACRSSPPHADGAVLADAAQRCQPPAIPCYVRGARCGQDEEGQAACVCSGGEGRQCSVLLQAV